MKKLWLFLLVFLMSCSSAENVAAPVEPVATEPIAHAYAEGDPAPKAEAREPISEDQPDPKNENYPQKGTLTGFVRDENGPVDGALVRVQLTDQTTLTNEIGYYELPDLEITQPITLTAWAEGYYPGGGKVTELQTAFDINLKAHYTEDNLHYTWFEFNGTNTSESCAPCHTAYNEWKADAHSQTATNPRFVSIYKGTDIHGNKGPAE